MSDFNPVPKNPYSKRKQKRGNASKITKSVRDEVLRRSECICERCGFSSSWGMEMAHLKSAAQEGRGDEYFNIVLLCGPSTNKGTCHNFADYTSKGREWRMNKRKELMQYYGRY